MKAQTTTLSAFRPRTTISDPDYVYGEMKQSFMIGEFEPGQKLTLPEIAAAFGTSQQPVREAVSRLVVARAIEALPRRSMRVPEATVAYLEALLPLRLHLEGEAARLATANAPSDQLAEELRQIDEAMRGVAPIEDSKTFLKLNQRFHFALYTACGNEHLVDLIELLWMRYGPLMNIVRNGGLSKSGALRHAQIINAMTARDAAAVQKAVCDDIQEAAEAIRGAILANMASFDGKQTG